MVNTEFGTNPRFRQTVGNSFPLYKGIMAPLHHSLDFLMGSQEDKTCQVTEFWLRDSAEIECVT
jgi:hypothetical protein